jgi:TPR repeat protein
MYQNGQGVEKDEKKALHHFLVEAAIGGHTLARNNLACHEERSGRIDRAVKHWTIAANLGDDGSIRHLKRCYEMEM